MIGLSAYLNESVRTGRKYNTVPFPMSPDDKDGLIQWLEFHRFENITDPENVTMVPDQNDYGRPTYQLGKYDGNLNHEWIMIGDGKGTVYFIRTTDRSDYGNRTEASEIRNGKWTNRTCTFDEIRKELERLVR